MVYPTLWRASRTPVWNGLTRTNFDRLFDGSMFGADSESGSLVTWSPAVDVREDDDGLQVSMELPGLGSDDVKVSVENGVLSISGERKRELEGKEGTDYHLVERRYGRFERTFTLPRGIDTEKVTAKFENGVLEVALPKSATAKPRSIEIK